MRKRKDFVVVALDDMSEGQAFKLVDMIIKAGLHNHGFWGVKLEDPSLNRQYIILKMLERGIRVFSDPKLFIARPERVPAIISHYTPADLISVCAFMATQALRESVRCVPSSRIAALLVPTSFDDAVCQSKFGRTVEGAVYEFALHAKMAGVQALICPPRELQVLSRYPEFKDMWRITPAIRPEWYKKEGSHQTTMTPRQALEAGADLLVIGEPITKAEDPVQALKNILEEIK